MINIQAKKHDNFSVEFKVGFNCTDDGKKDQFAVNAWMFVPGSLDVSPENYGKKQFYRDIKSNVRLITPSYLLTDIAKEDSLPLQSLRSSLEKVSRSSARKDQDAYEYHLKMFAAIFKSALRDQASHILSTRLKVGSEYLIADYISGASSVLSAYRSLYTIINVPTASDQTRTFFKMCDEFMSHVLDVRSLRLIKMLDSLPDSEKYESFRADLVQLVLHERQYKEMNEYSYVTPQTKRNRDIVHRHGMLKKFIESELYISLDKKKDGVALEQIYYSIAAGMAMVFATGVSWHYQIKYGNITWPLFAVLVISYMLKDRIKDLLRYYFAHKLGNKYFDKKANIEIGKHRVGEIKEGFDFVSRNRIPQEVLSMRDNASFEKNESRIFEEKVLLFRQVIGVNDAALASIADYPMRGINEIMRLHLTRFTQKMDNPDVPVDVLEEDGSISVVKVKKVYYINVVFLLTHDGKSKYHHFRIAMTRNGVIGIDEI